ncbi:MAG TPA: hypothetical protein VKA68_19260 [bacterium]|nr:hypothetical protein [bacterium]
MVIEKEHLKRGLSFGAGFLPITLPLLLMIYAASIFFILFASILIAMFVSWMAALISTRSYLSRTAALLTVIAGFPGILVTGGILAVPHIAHQLDTIRSF